MSDHEYNSRWNFLIKFSAFYVLEQITRHTVKDIDVNDTEHQIQRTFFIVLNKVCLMAIVFVLIQKIWDLLIPDFDFSWSNVTYLGGEFSEFWGNRNLEPHEFTEET